MNGVLLAITVGLAGLTQASSVSVGRQDTAAPPAKALGQGESGHLVIQLDRKPGPFEKLFIPPQPGRPEVTVVSPPDRTSKAPTSRVVCGMVVIEVDPALDPHMVIRPKDPDSARIRRIPATACVD